jgi:hypothetical protein
MESGACATNFPAASDIEIEFVVIRRRKKSKLSETFHELFTKTRTDRTTEIEQCLKNRRQNFYIYIGLLDTFRANFLFYFAVILAEKNVRMSIFVHFFKSMANIGKCKYLFKSSVDNVFINMHERHEASSFLQSAS